jgi:hypothetical protein
MITNPDIIKDKYACNEKTMRYLVFDCGLPVLGYSPDRRIWYFRDNDELRKHLKEMPLVIKILAFFKK